MSRKVNIFNSITACDIDALAFLAATGITDVTITDAICTLYSELKSAGIYNKLTAFYPFVGGTAFTHKFNGKNPLDTDAAYRVQFFGGVTHSSNGITGNAINGYCQTFIPNTSIPINSNHISTYSRTSINENSVDIGTYGQTGENTWGIHHSSRGFGIGMFFRNQNSTFGNFANTDGRGFYLSTRTSSVLATMYKNGVSAVSITASPVAMLNENFQILAINNTFHSSRNLAFASIGDGLSSAEVSDYYNIIQSFQTSLGRNV